MIRFLARAGGVAALVLAAHVSPASATYTVASGYAAEDFAVGFPRGGCCNLGPFGIAFDTAGNTFINGDGDGGSLYKFPAGGTPPFTATAFDLTASSAHFGDGCERGMAFSKAGRLYMSMCSANKIVELNPATGAVVRNPVAVVTSPHGLGTDPLSGDLFVTSYSAGGVYRITNPDSATPGVSTYVDPAVIGSSADGLTIGPDGTIYVARDTGPGTPIYSIAGTDKPQPAAAQVITNVDYADGVAVSQGAGTPQLFANDNIGHIVRVDLTDPPTQTVIFTNDDTTTYRGDFVGVGNDGCLYATQSERVVRITNADKTCSLAATSPTVPLDVAVTGPGSVTSAPAGITCGATCSALFDTGSTVTLTAAPNAGQRFSGWGGDCAGTAGTQCTVTMNAARSATATFVANSGPTAAFSFTPAGPATNQAVSFDGSTSSDADGTIVGYAWAFDDGGSASGVKPTHAFAAPGLHNVTLTVTDDSGATASVSHTVQVSKLPAAAVLPAALECTKKRVVLIDVLIEGGRVRLLGAADPSLAGQTASFVLTATGKVVATAVVQADGLFETTAPLPPKKIRATNKARYRAVVASESSDALKLVRRMTVTSIGAAGGTVTIRGRVVPPLAKPRKAIAVRRRLTCTKTVVVKTFKPSASGRYSVSFAAPAGVTSAIYTLVTKVRKNTRNPKLFPTATLPRPVTFAGG